MGRKKEKTIRCNVTATANPAYTDLSRLKTACSGRGFTIKGMNGFQASESQDNRRETLSAGQALDPGSIETATAAHTAFRSRTSTTRVGCS